MVGAAAVARSAGLGKFINLDMGGTSSDVSRYSGSFAYQSSHSVGDARVANIALRIETVAAGGGSICRIEMACFGSARRVRGLSRACLLWVWRPLLFDRCEFASWSARSSRFSTPVVESAARARWTNWLKRAGEPRMIFCMDFWQWRTMPWPMPSARYRWRKGMIRPTMPSCLSGEPVVSMPAGLRNGWG